LPSTPSVFPGGLDTFTTKANFSSTVADDDPNHIQNAVAAMQQILQLWGRSPLAYGAKGDGVTDDAPAIQAALDAAQADGGGIVVLPPPPVCYLLKSAPHTGAGLWTPPKVSLLGTSRDRTQIKLDASFPTGIPAIKMGDPNNLSGFCFHTRVEHLYINCNDVTGSSGIFTDAIQEQSGVFNVLIKAPQAYGFRSTKTTGPGAQNYRIADLEVIGSASTPSGMIPLLINGTNMGSPYSIENISLVALVGHQVTTSFQVDGCAPAIWKVHTEQNTDGILVGSIAACTGINLNRIDAGPNNTNVVHISNGSATTAYTLASIYRIGLGTTNTLLDDQYAQTVTEFIPLYSVGGGVAPNGTILSNATTVPNRISNLKARDGFAISRLAPAFATPYTPDPTNGVEVDMTLTANLTVNAAAAGPPAPVQGQMAIFVWKQDGTGGWTVTYNASWHTGGATAMVTTLNTATIDTFIYNGSFWRLISRITGQA